MKLLMDTHALLWFLKEPERLPSGLLDVIQDSGAETVVSIASLWEIAIKSSLGKLSLPAPFEELFPGSIAASDLELLEIKTSHLISLTNLPPHHRDPFDRLLIAQAKTEGLTIVTCDAFFPAYGVPLLW